MTAAFIDSKIKIVFYLKVMYMKKKIFAVIPLILGIVICAFAGYKILVINREYKASITLYSEQEELYVKKIDFGESDGNIIEKKAVDFKSLKKLNHDICGWIDIPQIKVSYPVLQGENDNTYLRHLPDGAYNIGGSIFIDERCENDFTSPVTVIYGHYMRNGSMFGRLKKFLDVPFLRKNPDFKIYTPNGDIDAHIVACFETDKDSDIYVLPESEITEEYAAALSKASGADFTGLNKEEYRIILLSTCSHSFESARTVVAAVYNP